MITGLDFLERTSVLSFFVIYFTYIFFVLITLI